MIGHRMLAGLLTAAAASACATGQAWQVPGTVRISGGMLRPVSQQTALRPEVPVSRVPVVTIGEGQATIRVRIVDASLKTLAANPKTASQVQRYEIDLVLDTGTPNAGNNYTSATVKGTANLTGPAGGGDLGVTNQMTFNAVGVGTYRVRVRAIEGASTNITKELHAAGPQHAVSNTVNVPIASPATYSVTCTVPLLDGLGEPAQVYMNVIPGAAIPAITSNEI